MKILKGKTLFICEMCRGKGQFVRNVFCHRTTPRAETRVSQQPPYASLTAIVGFHVSRAPQVKRFGSIRNRLLEQPSDILFDIFTCDICSPARQAPISEFPASLRSKRGELLGHMVSVYGGGTTLSVNPKLNGHGILLKRIQVCSWDPTLAGFGGPERPEQKR